MEKTVQFCVSDKYVFLEKNGWRMEDFMYFCGFKIAKKE